MKEKTSFDTLSINGIDDPAMRRLADCEFELIQIINGGKVWQDLNFLIPFKDKIKKLRVTGIVNGFLGLDMLNALTELDLDDYFPLPVVDFSTLSQLEICKMGWSSKMQGKNFFSIPRLEKISLARFKAENSEEIGLAKKLKCLELRHGTLGSLRGLEGCCMLEELRLIKVSGLTSLDGLDACKALKIIEIEASGRIENITACLERFSNLTCVLLEGDFALNSLAWVANNPGLTSLRADVVIPNIDWRTLFSAPKLEDLALKYKPGSLCTNEEIKNIATSCGKHIQWIELGGTRRAPWIEIHFKKNL
ncbi:MAG: hypothetical protein V4495_24535 [Pseudomonadota bacterium]